LPLECERVLQEPFGNPSSDPLSVAGHKLYGKASARSTFVRVFDSSR
jgi:hypothetical protein